jgi:hypothetical protein
MTGSGVQSGEPPEWLSWQPEAPEESSNFRTRKLLVVSPSRLEYRATLADRLFSGLFAGLGSLGLIVAPFAYLHAEDALISAAFCSLLGSLFLGFGLWSWRKGSAVLAFDREDGVLWSPAKRRERDVTDRANISGLQLLSRIEHGDNGDWPSHELHLVEAKSRRLIVDQPGLVEARRDAERLASFFEVPLWDRASDSPRGDLSVN